MGSCRFVFNHFLAVRRDQWEINKLSVSYNLTSSMLTDLKRREETSWLKEVDSMSLQESLRNLDNSYQNFFKKRSGYPKFKSKHCHAQSYRTRNQNNGVRFVGVKLNLPKVGLVRTKQHRTFEGKILNATVSRTASGKYYVSLCVEYEDIHKDNLGGVIGIDVGIKVFYTDSNGNFVANPKYLEKYAKKLTREQRRLSNKMPRSNNRTKQRIKVARIYERISNCRKDFLHKQSTKLVRENKVIAIEDLKIKNMLKNRRLAKAISDVSWSEFFRQLEYKAELYRTEIVKVPTFFPSSQTCNVCGYKNKEVKNLAVREWTCPKCHEHHDRDRNAAINILRRIPSEGREYTLGEIV